MSAISSFWIVISRPFFLRCTDHVGAVGEIFVKRKATSRFACHATSWRLSAHVEPLPSLPVLVSSPHMAANPFCWPELFHMHKCSETKGNPWYWYQWKSCQNRHVCVCAEMEKPCFWQHHSRNHLFNLRFPRGTETEKLANRFKPIFRHDVLYSCCWHFLKKTRFNCMIFIVNYIY